MNVGSFDLGAVSLGRRIVDRDLLLAGLPHQLVIAVERFVLVKAEIVLLPIDLDVPNAATLPEERLGGNVAF